MEEECPCNDDYRNHGMYMKCVNDAIGKNYVLSDFSDAVIEETKSKLAQSACGK